MAFTAFRLILIVMAFTLEVKANDSAKPFKLLQEPKGCLEMGATGCHVGVTSGQYEFKKDDLHVLLPKLSILVRKKDHWSLLDGQALIVHQKAGEALGFQLGTVMATRDAAYLLMPEDREFMNWKLIVTKGEVVIKDSGDAFGEKESAITVVEGFEVKLKGFNANGGIISEIPHPFELYEFLKTWGPLQRVSKEELISQMKDLRELRGLAVERASQAAKEITLRKLAAQSQAEREAQRKRRLKLKEEAELRALFIKRNYLDL